ncbi:MAG: hypothetical protein KFF49_04240 [Bacteroidales bacterium]|nr:hypothetical protein [Bacteroidales bacterium]
MISLLLLLATAGISISSHYCGDRLRSVSVMNTPDKCCDDASCCHNETNLYQLDEDFTIQNSGIKFLPEHQAIDIPCPAESIPVAENTPMRSNTDLTHHPPVRTYLALIQSFLL